MNPIKYHTMGQPGTLNASKEEQFITHRRWRKSGVLMVMESLPFIERNPPPISIKTLGARGELGWVPDS